jgi:hypothetical protein
MSAPTRRANDAPGLATIAVGGRQMTKSQNSTRRPLADPVLARYAKQIRGLAKRTVNDIIKIGALLTKAKKRLKHGDFLSWAYREFGWSADTTQRIMRVSALVGKNRNLRHLSPSVLYLLAKKSTSEEVRGAVAARIEAGAGGRITLSEVRHMAEPPAKRIAPTTHDAPEPNLPTITAEVLQADVRKRLVDLIVDVASRLPHDQSFEEASAVVESIGDAEGMRERFSEAVAKLGEFVGQLQRALNEQRIKEPAAPPLRAHARRATCDHGA